MRTIHTDCLVLGAGLAGSAYAWHAARAGFKVELLSLGEPLRANSDWAQGGIIYDTSPDPAQPPPTPPIGTRRWRRCSPS